MNSRAIQVEIEEIITACRAPVHFQPIYRSSGELLGIEALLRVAGHPPMDVIAQAESDGSLLHLELAILASCIKVAAQRADVGKVHVNLSWKTLSDARFASHIRSMISVAGVAPERISIELSERESIADHSTARASLASLADIGVTFAIDDFGAGFNHLAAASSIPIHSLKIDRSIIRTVTGAEGVGARERSKRLLLGMKLLAKALDAELVLEGIEGPEDRSLMADLEAAGQGDFLGRPAPIEHLVLNGRLRSFA